MGGNYRAYKKEQEGLNLLWGLRRCYGSIYVNWLDVRSEKKKTMFKVVKVVRNIQYDFTYTKSHTQMHCPFPFPRKALFKNVFSQ